MSNNNKRLNRMAKQIATRVVSEFIDAMDENPTVALGSKNLGAWVLIDSTFKSGWSVQGVTQNHDSWQLNGKPSDLCKAMLGALDGMDLPEESVAKAINGIRGLLKKCEKMFEQEYGKPCP